MIWGIFARKSKKLEVRKRAVPGVLKPYDLERVAKEWERVEQLIEIGRPSALKEAIIIADKLLDYALVQISSGETMGERLKNARGAFPRSVYQALWEAHKVRNALVHDPDYDLTQVVARDALSKFRMALQVLQVKL